MKAQALRILTFTVALLFSTTYLAIVLAQDIGIRKDDSKPSGATKKPRPKTPTQPVAKPAAKQRVALTIITDPSDSEVYINDAYRGTTSPDSGKLIVPDLETGAKYTIRVNKRGVGQEVQIIELTDAQELTISIKKAEVKDEPKVAEKPPEPKVEKPAEPKPVIKPPQSQMVLIPAGEVTIGTNDKDFLFESARPQHKVNLPAFFIDVFEVTNAEYKLFCDATGHAYPENPSWDNNYFLGKPNHPVVKVSWDEANAYAEWVGKRLPTEEEWEKAARGTDNRPWPWGKEVSPTVANLAGDKDNFIYTAPIGSFRTGASVYGVNDLVGNVWEWTASAYKPYPNSKFQDPNFSKDYRVIRGGGFQSAPTDLKNVAFRFPSEPDVAYEATGFRCARSQ